VGVLRTLGLTAQRGHIHIRMCICSTPSTITWIHVIAEGLLQELSASPYHVNNRIERAVAGVSLAAGWVFMHGLASSTADLDAQDEVAGHTC
jgi:hypothetical protein